MADGTIYVPVSGTGAAPQSYTTPGATTIDLQAVRAIFDGSGAGGDFLPAVQILDSSGNVMATVVGEQVTAGDSADVTFAPFLRAPSTAAPTASGGVAWGYVQSSALINLPYATQTTWTFTPRQFRQDGSGIFSFDPLTPTQLFCSPPANSSATLTIQAYARSAVDPAVISPDYIYGFLTPPLPDPSGIGTSNGVYSRFIDDQRPFGGVLQVRYTLIEQLVYAPMGIEAMTLAFFNADPGMGNYAMRAAWLGASLTWQA